MVDHRVDIFESLRFQAGDDVRDHTFEDLRCEYDRAEPRLGFWTFRCMAFSMTEAKLIAVHKIKTTVK